VLACGYRGVIRVQAWTYWGLEVEIKIGSSLQTGASSSRKEEKYSGFRHRALVVFKG